MGKQLVSGIIAAVVSGVAAHFAVGLESPSVFGAAFGFLIYLVGHTMGAKEYSGSRSEREDDER